MKISVGKTLLGFLAFILILNLFLNPLTKSMGVLLENVQNFFAPVTETVPAPQVPPTAALETAAEIPTTVPATQVPTLPPPTQVPTVQPPPTPQQVQVISCTNLGENGEYGRSCLVTSDLDQQIPVTEGGWTLIAGGNFTLQYGQVSRQFTANAEEGNLVYLIGNPGDGTSSDGNLIATLSGHTAGNLVWTQIHDSSLESPQVSAERQISIMQNSQGNCGDAGCLNVKVHYVYPDGTIASSLYSR